MPSSLSTNMETEMKGLDRIFPVAEVTFSSKLQFAEAPVASTSAGLYLAQVVGGFGTYTRRAGWTDYSLTTPRTNITIYDEDRVLQKELGGTTKSNVRGSVWQNYLRSNYVNAADHYKFFDGIIVDYSIKNRNYTFAISPDVRPMNSNPKIPKASKVDWPDMPTDFVGNDLWVVYGEHNSDGIADSNGMINCIPAKEEANGDVDQWICSYGQLVEITNLFVDGVSAFANWGFAPVQRGNNYYQLAILQSGTSPTKSSKITIDAKGLFDTTPTSGTFISNPADIMRHFLRNFVYGDGSVLPASAWTTGGPVSNELFNPANTFFTDRSIKGSKVIFSSDKPSSVFSSWCKSFNALPAWSDKWEIGATPIDPTITSIYLSDSAIVKERYQQSLADSIFNTANIEPFTDISTNSVLDTVRSGLVEARRFVNRRDGTIVTGPDLDITYGESKLQVF